MSTAQRAKQNTSVFSLDKQHWRALCLIFTQTAVALNRVIWVDREGKKTASFTKEMPAIKENLRKKNKHFWCLCLQSGTLTPPAYYSFGSAKTSQWAEARQVKQRSIFPKAMCRLSDQHDNLLLWSVCWHRTPLGVISWYILGLFMKKTRRQKRCLSLYLLNYWTLNRGWHTPPAEMLSRFWSSLHIV